MRLIVEDLAFRYARHLPYVVDGLSFVVEQGEPLAIVGPSGHGKTTVLSLVGGLLSPERGRVALVDEPWSTERVMAHSSWVLQTVNILPNHTLVENVAMGALSTAAGWRESTVRARNALSRVGLDERGGELARNLSGGEAQRGVIARALASDNPILLADEPTGQLDDETSRSVGDVLLTTAKDRVVLIVTHDVDLAARCARRIRIAHGRAEAL